MKWAGVDYLDLNTNWPLAASFQRNAESLGRTFFPIDKLPAGSSGSTDMGNVDQLASIHPMLASAPSNVVISPSGLCEVGRLGDGRRSRTRWRESAGDDGDRLSDESGSAE